MSEELASLRCERLIHAFPSMMAHIYVKSPRIAQRELFLLRKLASFSWWHNRNQETFSLSLSPCLQIFASIPSLTLVPILPLIFDPVSQ